MDETCIIEKWIRKRVHMFRTFGKFRPTYDWGKVQEDRMIENFMYGQRRGQGKRSNSPPERDAHAKEERQVSSHDLYTIALLSYSTTTLLR